MPSEDNLAEPVPTSHFTGQQGQGPRMGPIPHPLPTLFLSCHCNRCQALSTILGPSARWALGLHRIKSLPALGSPASPPNVSLQV